MKREDITALFPDATKEQLDKIMALHGADINNARGGVDTLQQQLTAASAELEQLKANANGIEEDREALTNTRAELEALRASVALRDIRDKVSRETGVPAALLTGETEEDCTAQASAIRDYAKTNAYPTVPHSGEPVEDVQATTRTQFADWFNNITK